MFDIKTHFEPSVADIGREIARDAEELTRGIIKDVATIAPMLMRESFVSPPSARGTAPARRTGYLSDTLKGEVINNETGQIEMAEYARYLDPFLGGKLDRPFILPAIAKTLDQIR